MNQVKLGEAEALFAVLRQSADADVVAAIEALVRDAPDPALNRVNVLDFAAKRGLDQERVIAAFLHAARVGLFDLSWNVLCPGCGGVLDANTSLKTVHEDAYSCALCGAGYEPTLDEMVEVSFTVNPRVRKIAAHDPYSLPMWEYHRQIFWSTGIDLPENIEDILAEIVLDSIELPPGERASLSLQLPQQFVIVFEPVTHSAQFLDVKGEPTRERQNLSVVFNKVSAPVATLAMRPGPLRLSLENRTDARVLPGVWIAGDALHHLLGKRRPFLTAKRLLTNQTFRGIKQGDGGGDLLLKIGIHEGPCLAVTLNDRQDYFGQTVNIAARVQGLAASRSIFATEPVVDHPQSSSILRTSGLKPLPKRASLRGIADEFMVYEIP